MGINNESQKIDSYLVPVTLQWYTVFEPALLNLLKQSIELQASHTFTQRKPHCIQIVAF